MRISISLIALLINIHVHSQGIRDILEKSIRETDKIETFEYELISQTSAPYDTTEYVRKYSSKITGVINRMDDIIGYNYIAYIKHENEERAYLIYDSDFSVIFDWHNKTAEITDFRKYPVLRKNIYAPFYLSAKTMFDFALNCNEADITVVKDDGDTLVFDIFFYNNRYEFRGKKIIKQGEKGYAQSNYRVWIDKKSYLPTKILRMQKHQKSSKEIKWNKINTLADYEIDALSMIPGDFTIREYSQNHKHTDLSGTRAPEFKLPDIYNDSISLSDYTGKVILLEFTSIGCGPCHHAIPELIKLHDELDSAKFELLSIESFVPGHSKIFEKYITRNRINYPFVIGDKKVKNNYKVQGVPFFIIIDKEGIIRESVLGYEKTKTIKHLWHSIEAMID